MASPTTLKWLDRLVWTLVYGGLLTLVVGIATRRTDEPLGWSLLVAGAAVAAVGFFLIWVRSRLRDPAAPQPKGRP
ncbi:hypothetical protein [Ramlibacter tataouinensis]|uniref:Uncharacterized protein n=1 Tax=Ramlibacter tataouinensis (strain ATCC BAA-407 / DSM 14655 / LMG 21543 / TTB310) TaxID=365046 RepID=F5XXV9_RAMTT|nr:hypothetical protein [Ramlibacter tataouinensis]AEG93094.1 hypothetical protein Rta_20020 [Ramlibacter tataouinensis TTB310]